MASNVKLDGADEAAAEIKRWADQLGPVIAKAADRFGDQVADTVRHRLPHLSGQLAGSVDVDTNDDGLDVSLGSGVPYAGWIEFGGTRGRPYVPNGRYLYPSALDAEAEFARLVGDAAADSVERFSWS